MCSHFPALQRSFSIFILQYSSTKACNLSQEHVQYIAIARAIYCPTALETGIFYRSSSLQRPRLLCYNYIWEWRYESENDDQSSNSEDDLFTVRSREIYCRAGTQVAVTTHNPYLRKHTRVL